MQIIETPIKDLVIALNRVISDQRGYLAEMAPGGLKHPFMACGFGNLYASVATGKHIPRAGHYHLKAWENHYTLTGTALWLFTDFRNKQPTFGQSFEVIVGGEKLDKVRHGVSEYTLDKGVMAQVYCGPGINHIVWPLTDEPVVIVDVSSEPYDKEDYVYPKLGEIPGIEEILGKYGIILNSKIKHQNAK